MIQKTSLTILLVSLQLFSFASHKVYIIHGYAGSRLMMKKIEKTLKKEHYCTENYKYRSMKDDLDSIGKQLYLSVKNSHVDTVSFVTHSMGALVVRSMFQYSAKDHQFPIIFRMVMIAPPNGGAEIADFYSSLEILKKLLGPNVEHMRTDSNSYANKLPVPNTSEIGIIAGIYGKDHGYNPWIEGDNDGLLTPKRTKLGIEKQLVILKGEHNTLTQKKAVRKLVFEFLRFGKFISVPKS